jgi:hypothetical protein
MRLEEEAAEQEREHEGEGARIDLEEEAENHLDDDSEDDFEPE